MPAARCGSGNPSDLERYVTLWSNRNLFERLPRLVYSVLLVVLAGFLLALYFAQKGHNEYLWLALHELALAPVGFVELAGSSGHLDSLWFAALVLQSDAVLGLPVFRVPHLFPVAAQALVHSVASLHRHRSWPGWLRRC